jgi:hypothetical protein
MTTNPEPSDGVIRISKEEATSSHVDDLLKRQMSLRGEPGVTRDRGRKWYYQSWLVLGCVGLLGAVLAWAILEPYFDDTIYIQGPISVIDLASEIPRDLREADETGLSRVLPMGSIIINGEKIFVLRGTKEIQRDGRKKKLDLLNLKVGEVVGAHVEYYRMGEDSLAFGRFVVRSPAPLSKNRAEMSLEQLDSRSNAVGLLLFPVIAGLIGLFIGAADGLVCRLPRRALLCGGVGLLVGFVGGFISSIAATVAYAPLSALAMKQTSGPMGSLSTFGFVLQMLGRSLAWGLAGLAMGLAQGIALRSKRLLLYGFLGGVVGGVFGGLLFDPIDMILLGPDKPSSHWSRLIGFGVIGLSVGVMIGVVELLARDAWLRMTQGPLTGKEFLLFKDVMNIGSSPRSDIYLFNDPQVAEQHAMIRAVGDECEIEARNRNHPVLLNNRTVQTARLRHGDNVTIGRTSFIFQRRKG